MAAEEYRIVFWVVPVLDLRLYARLIQRWERRHRREWPGPDGDR